MRLIEKGLLNLNDPVFDHIPDFGVKDKKQIRRLTYGKQRQDDGKHSHQVGGHNKRKERRTHESR